MIISLILTFSLIGCKEEAVEEVAEAVEEVAEAAEEVAEAAEEVAEAAEEVDFSGKELNVLLSAATFSESLEPYISEFEEMYNVKVNFDMLGVANFYDKFVMEQSSGSDAHDVLYVFNETLEQYVGNDWLFPIEDLIADKSITDDALLNMDDFADAVVKSCSSQGKLYGIPIFTTTVIQYYRIDYFEQAGIEAPPTTWDELVEACKKLKDIGVEPIGMRGSKEFGAGSSWHLPMLTHSFGGKVFKDYPNDYTPTVNSKEYVAAVQFYSDLLNNYGMKGATTCTYEDIILAVQQGNLGIWIDGAPIVAQYENTEKSASAGKIGFALPPAGPEGITAAQTSHMIAINPNAREKELAWKFIQWAASSEVGLVLATEEHHVASPRASVVNDPAYIEQNNYGDGDWAKMFEETLRHAQWDYYPWSPDWPEVSDIITNSLSEVFTGRDAQTAMDEANEKIYKLLESKDYYN